MTEQQQPPALAGETERVQDEHGTWYAFGPGVCASPAPHAAHSWWHVWNGHRWALDTYQQAEGWRLLAQRLGAELARLTGPAALSAAMWAADAALVLEGQDRELVRLRGIEAAARRMMGRASVEPYAAGGYRWADYPDADDGAALRDALEAKP